MLFDVTVKIECVYEMQVDADNEAEAHAKLRRRGASDVMTIANRIGRRITSIETVPFKCVEATLRELVNQNFEPLRKYYQWITDKGASIAMIDPYPMPDGSHRAKLFELRNGRPLYKDIALWPDDVITLRSR